MDVNELTGDHPPTLDELRQLQERTRQEGRCGSLQTQSGLPCRRSPAPGYTVCYKHGARVPSTIAKAERSLALLRMPAIEALMDIIDQWMENTCELCGYPRRGETEDKRVIVQTAKLILDRTGLGPRATLDVNARRTDDGEALVEHMTDAEREQLRGLIDQVNILKAAVRGRLATTIDVSPLPIAEGVLSSDLTPGS